MDDAPPPITSSEPGSFPWTVLHERHPALLEQVLAGLPYPPERRRAIERLALEITGTIEPLGPLEPVSDHGPDAALWAGWAAPYLGRRWDDVEFLWAENYFYRKLLAATGYFEPGPWQGIDPFGPVKAQALAAEQVDGELAAFEALAQLSPSERTGALLSAALWGNRADLGFLLTAAGGPAARDEGRLVVDDRPALVELLHAGLGQVMLVADNAGPELLADLVLIDHLLQSGLASAVVLQVKPSPYFVSDATLADVLACLRRLSAGPVNGPRQAQAGAQGSEASRIGARLAAALREGSLRIEAHPFSVAPADYRQLPPDLRADVAASDLTIMKGDLNYRRLLGDRHWPATTPFAELTASFPSPVAALRTLKSDVVAGLDAARLAALDATAEPWRTTGTHALIQLRA